MRMSKATVLAGVAGLVLTVSPVLAQGGAGGGQGGNRGGDRQPGNQRGGGQGGDQGGGRRFGGGGPGGGGGMMGAFNSPTMNSRELTKYSEILALDGDQKEAAKALLDGYEQSFNTKREEMREKIQQAREEARNNGGGGGGGGGFAAFREIGQKWQADREKLDKDFMNDLKGLLTPEQEKANWARFERVHRRDHSMDRGLMSGERMDVVKLVEDAKLDPDTKAKVDPILARYEEDLDRELQNRDQVQKETFAKMADAMGDQDAMQKLIQTGREAAVRVRDVNRKYAREVQAELPEDKAFEFAKAVKQASFPNVYNETFGQRSITSALGFRDLTDEQKQTITTIRDAYTRDLAGLNDKIAAAQEQMEMNFNAGQMMGGGRGDQGELGDLRREKRDLDRATLDKLEAALTEDQKARLPQPEARGQGGPGGRGGDQGGDNGGQNRRQRNRNRPDRET
jgi:hypothetical protein